jgi:hypothetical protein
MGSAARSCRAQGLAENAWHGVQAILEAQTQRLYTTPPAKAPWGALVLPKGRPASGPKTLGPCFDAGLPLRVPCASAIAGPLPRDAHPCWKP